jgi:hypothetical protein
MVEPFRAASCHPVPPTDVLWEQGVVSSNLTVPTHKNPANSGLAVKTARDDAMKLIVARADEYSAGLRARGEELAQRADRVAVLQAALEQDRKDLIAGWVRLFTGQGDNDYPRHAQSGEMKLTDRFQPVTR